MSSETRSEYSFSVNADDFPSASSGESRIISVIENVTAFKKLSVNAKIILLNSGSFMTPEAGCADVLQSSSESRLVSE
jgi:hypothetical protein